MADSTAVLDTEALLDAVASGQRLSQLAPSTGLTRQRLSQVLTKLEPYKQAVESGFEELDKAEDAIWESADSLSLARAREGFKAVSWRAEREVPHRWGMKTDQAVSVTVQIASFAVQQPDPVPPIEVKVK